MHKKLRETTNLSVEITNSKRQVERKLGQVVQIRVCSLTLTWYLKLSVDEPAKTAGVSAKIQLLYIITIQLFLSLYAHLVLKMNRT